jgi:type II secretory pathway pseudopilin PulG
MRLGNQQSGFTLIAVLAAMLLLSLGLQAVMTVLSQQAQRDREAELLRVGAAFARAIGAYYRASPGSVKNWPTSLQQLTEDRRFVDTRRYLRQVYADPMMRSNDWGTVPAPDGGVAGVFSLSSEAPLRQAPQELEGYALPAASRYSDWKFVFMPELPNEGRP